MRNSERAELDKMIPAEAVEAAARALADRNRRPKEWSFYLSEARSALEAAAPHMLAIAWDEGFSEGWDTGDPHANPYRQP